ncbi:MAG: hypothetical protein LBL93_04690 [Ruminococcus sp.]|jgi:hypothetical protein|nr:hypothetical protein [Ruminococcus sp.]
MKLKFISLALAMMMLFAFVSCDKSSNEKIASFIIREPTEDNLLQFDFDTVSSTLMIDGKNVKLPCSLDELGKSFSYNTTEQEYYISKKDGWACYDLLCNGENIGEVIFNYEEDDKNLNDNLIYYISLGNRSVVDPKISQTPIEFAGLKLYDARNKVLEKLGEPTEIKNPTSKEYAEHLRYDIFLGEMSKEKHIVFKVLNNEITNINIAVPLT